MFLNTMVMLDAADLGPLPQYQARVERMLERYGERTWALLHPADARARLEEWPRIRMELKVALRAAAAQETQSRMRRSSRGMKHGGFSLIVIDFGHKNSWNRRSS